jgi:hypothetical protein
MKKWKPRSDRKQGEKSGSIFLSEEDDKAIWSPVALRKCFRLSDMGGTGWYPREDPSRDSKKGDADGDLLCPRIE